MAEHLKIGEPVNKAEEWGFRYLKDNLDDGYTILTNLDLYDDHNQPFEVDAVIIGEFAVYLIDIKGYTGKLLASKDVWQHNDRIVDNPIPKLNYNSRVFAARCRKHTKFNQHTPWCQSMIFVTGGEGGDVLIDTNNYPVPVYSKDNIIEALTKMEFVTSQYKHKLEQYQKDNALNALCDFRLLKNKAKEIGDYRKIRKISTQEKIELWLVEPIGHEVKYQYWMEVVDITSCDSNEVTFYNKLFKKKYYVLNELSDVQSVPVVLSLISDGEFLAIVHQLVSGERLSKSTLNNDDVIKVFRNTASAIASIQSKGIHHRTLSKNNIYIDSDYNIQLLGLGYAKTDAISTIVSAEQLDNPWFAPEYIFENKSSDESDVFTLAQVFISYFTDSQPVSENTINFIDERYEFSSNDLCNSLHGLDEWFNGAVEIEPDLRPSIRDLLNILDSNINIVSNEVINELHEGVILQDKYEILSRIGKGGTSTIWKAKHLLGDYECCIKLLDEFEGADDVAKKEFEILRTSYHPNIIRIFDLDRLPNTERYFLTCQYIDGDDLSNSDLSPSELWGCFLQILSAIQYLHRINIIHKDLKPENIIIDGAIAYLIDFNISSFDSRALGTISYKDPNVKTNGWSNFSDIYSLAISFVEMITGIHPFHENDGIPTLDIKVELNTEIKGITSNTRNKLQKVLNHDVEWEGIQDYAAWFELTREVEITIPNEIKEKWNISDGYMVKVLKTMLTDLQPHSRTVIVQKTLRSNGIPGNKTNRSSVGSTISSLKKNNIVEEAGKKIKLTKEFIIDWNK